MYVDDILYIYAPTLQARADQVVEGLKKHFKLQSDGSIDDLLGVRCTYDEERRTLKLSQGDTIDALITKVGMTDARSAHTPLPTNARFTN